MPFTIKRESQIVRRVVGKQPTGNEESARGSLYARAENRLTVSSSSASHVD
jgi:hypothetical protein